jgi:integrase
MDKVAWTAAMSGAKIEDFRFHDLGHTAAIRLAAAGTDAISGTQIEAAS